MSPRDQITYFQDDSECLNDLANLGYRLDRLVADAKLMRADPTVLDALNRRFTSFYAVVDEGYYDWFDVISDGMLETVERISVECPALKDACDDFAKRILFFG